MKYKFILFSPWLLKSPANPKTPQTLNQNPGHAESVFCAGWSPDTEMLGRNSNEIV